MNACASFSWLNVSVANLRPTSSQSVGSLARLPLSRLLSSVHLFVSLNSTFISRLETHGLGDWDFLTVNSHLEHHQSWSSLLSVSVLFCPVLSNESLKKVPGPLRSITGSMVLWIVGVLSHEWPVCCGFCSVLLSHVHITLCDPHGLQHTRLPCPSPCSGVCSNSCPLSQWCHPTTSSSVIPFSSCL